MHSNKKRINMIVSQLYIAEIFPAKHRGSLTSLNSLGLGFGILTVYCNGAVLHWRWLAIVGAIPAALMSLLMLFCPETPRWLVKVGKIHEARSSLTFLRRASPEECETELEEIKHSLGK